MRGVLKRAFPFLDWFRDFSFGNLRVDFVAGLTVALVLIPQSMAYAQLAGMPAYYGLYAAFLPPMIAALFGSSRQLATGPVAIVSLMTSAALEPLATAGSEAYIAYALVLAMVVGFFQLGLGLLRLGVIVNFLSHPVVNGFTNAGAIIIASSQLSKLFGVYVDKAEHHYETIWRVVVAAVDYTHWPTLGLAALAFALMYGLKRVNPRIPFVLVAVGVTTVIAWSTGLEHNEKAPVDALRAPKMHEAILKFNQSVNAIEALGEQRAKLGQELIQVAERLGERSERYLKLANEKRLLDLRIEDQKERSHLLREELRASRLRGVREGDGLVFYPVGQVQAGVTTDGRTWRLKVGNTKLDTAGLTMMGGGAVVGLVPKGLPSLALPPLDLKGFMQFFAVAVIISLLGFMEAISIAKAMAAKTGQRLDPNQELIGQGLANILGAIGRSYPVSGSFSRSAVNLGAGAVTGMSSVFTSLVVVATLLFFTPLLYHIPQSVLAAVIMMAVVGLINVKGFVHTYRAQRYDGVIAVITFFCTLAFAPELDRGIMVGVVLSIGHYLYRNSRPSLAALSLHPDRSLRDAQRHGLQECKNIAVVRFEGPLFFANTSYLEDQINEHIKGKPELRHILLPANGINEIDASGEEALSLIVEQIRERGLEISLSGLNENVLDLMKRTHLLEKIGEDHIFPTMMVALKSIHARAHVGSTEEECPLLKVTFLHPDMFEVGKPVLRDFRVLFLSRDEEHAKGLIKSLRRKGIDVALSVDPEVALRMMRNRFHEVVVMDTVAEPNEEVLLREFCSDWPEAQLIVLGGTESADVAFKLGQCGAYEYLQRDCAVEDLVKTINRAVYDARMRDAERG